MRAAGESPNVAPMCGRFVITTPPQAMKELFGYAEQPNFPPRRNIAPTQPVPVIHTGEGHTRDGARHFSLMRWGLVPSWMKKFPDSVLINARAETILEKPSFRGGIRRQRALIPADGFYEWDIRTKQPYFIHLESGGPFAMAAIWEDWMGADGAQIESAAIVTVAAKGRLAPIHPRSPAILDESAWDAWLDTENTRPDEAVKLLYEPGAPALAFHPVSTRVNKVANDDENLTLPVDADRGPGQLNLL